MNKKGFTLIELIVSIVLVTVILVSLLATLVKLKQTYEVIEEDSDIRIYSASISRHINNDIITNKGITSGTCNEEGSRCELKLKNGEERVIEVYTTNKGTVEIFDEAGKRIGRRRTDLSTVSYTDKKTNKRLFIRTIEMENRMDLSNPDKLTTYGYKFIGISLTKYSYDNKKNTTMQDVISVLTLHMSDENYNIKIYGNDTVSKSSNPVTPVEPVNPPVTGLACTTGNSSLTQGTKFTRGSYIYSYKQEGFWTRMQGNQYNWVNITADGWGVKLVNRSSTSPITDEICATIDGKPIVSTSHMYINSKATSIDVSSLKSSNVVNMSNMFEGTAATTITGLDKLDTSNVTNMFSTFYATKVSILDLSSFNTSKVTNMNYIFSNTSATIGYARNNSEVSKFNALSTSYKPSTLRFKLK